MVVRIPTAVLVIFNFMLVKHFPVLLGIAARTCPSTLSYMALEQVR